MTFPTIEELIQQAEYKQHPYGITRQPFDAEMFAELVCDVDRRGLDKDITRYQDMILEGWHRYLASLATKTTPKFIDFKGTDLEAAELVHASELRRHSKPDQRYASLDLLCEACPDFKAKYEALTAKGEQQQKDGKPLDTDAQRVDVIGAKAEAAGVSKTTGKKVERVKKQNPAAVAEIAAGRTTANKELAKLPKKEKTASKPPKAQAKKTPTVTDKSKFTVGDKIYQVTRTCIFSKLEVTIYAYEISSVGKKTYVSTGGKQVKKEEAVTLDEAKKARMKFIEDWIEDLEEELKDQREILTKEPKIKVQK